MNRGMPSFYRCGLLALALSTTASAEAPKVTGIEAFCRDGQVFVTWMDAAEGEEGSKYRYTVYRSEEPIAQNNLDRATPIIRGILNNSCKLLGMDLTAKDRLDPDKPRLRLADRGARLPMWSGVGVYTVVKEGKGFYAVTATDLDLNPLSAIVPGESATSEPVAEQVAAVEPIRQFAAEEQPARSGGISGRRGLPLYVQLHASCSSKSWMTSSGDYFAYFAPRQEMGWRVGQPGVFGLSEDGGEHSRLLLSPRDTMNTPEGLRGVENLWFGLLCQPNWSADPLARAYPFAELRVEWLVKWAIEKYGADPMRICMGGQSMGAWGTFSIGLKRPELFAALYPTGPKCHQWLLSGIGDPNRIYLRGPTREKNIPEADLRKLGGKPPMLPDGKTEFFDYLDLIAYVEKTHGDLPFACFIGGRQGRKPWAGYAKWENMVAMVKALQKNRHGFGFGWDNKGHGSAKTQFEKLKQYYPWHIFALDQSYPAFSNSSLDDDIGPDGPDEGYVNLGFRWHDVVDEEGRWAAAIGNGEVKGDMTADVTPRRCQKFKARPGEQFEWSNSAGASGAVSADRWGLVTVEKFIVRPGRESLLTIKRRSPSAGRNGQGRPRP